MYATLRMNACAGVRAELRETRELETKEGETGRHDERYVEQYGSSARGKCVFRTWDCVVTTREERFARPLVRISRCSCVGRQGR